MTLTAPAPTRWVPGVAAPARVATPAVALVVLTVLLQRIAVPAGSSGQVPVLVPVGMGVLILGIAGGHLVVSRTRLALFSAAIAACSVAAAVDLLRGEQWSPLSFVYLLALYLPFVVGLAHPSAAAVERVLGVFCRLMAVLSVVAIVHFAAQFAGWSYRDLLADVVPEQFLVTGFNTASPISFKASVYRENGIVFLEPSFFSQYLALAVLAHLHLRRRGPAIWLFLIALLTTVSGTGVLLLAVGVVVLAMVRGHRQLLRFAVPSLLVVVAVSFTPLGTVFATRLNDQTGSGSSAYERFVDPYTILLGEWHGDVSTLLAGQGPGAADRLADEVSEGLLAPVLAKMLLEYGLVAAVAFVLFAGYALLAGSRAPPVSAGLVAAYFVLNAATLVPAVVLLAVGLHVWFASPEQPDG